MNRALRILFYGSSLEPGRDGVGDYVRLLAEACSRQGHTCAIVALHDPFVTAREESWTDAAGGIPSLRLPASESWDQRIKSVTEFRARFRPTWISFHLVPYAFQPRAILIRLIPTFRALTEGTALHLMFHELWLGAGRPSPLRHYLIGGVQSFAVSRLLTRLQPQLVTVSNPVYAAMLGLGVSARVLPLFGNVPLLDPALVPPLEQLLPGAPVASETRENWWVGLFFGALHEQWKPEPFFTQLLHAAQRAGRKICLVLAGRAHRKIWSELTRSYAGRIEFIDLGEQAAPTISALLQTADFGISCSPWNLIGKSGTLAAMLDHGLPVIVTRDDFQPFLKPVQPPTSDPLVHRCDDQLEAKLVAGLTKRPPRPRLDEIAAQLCAELACIPPLRP